MENSDDNSNDSSEQERIKHVKAEKKKLKRKLVESREDSKPGLISLSNATLNTFLGARKHLKTVRDKPNTQHYLTINPDEEVWIFQCPKNIETDDLLGRKLVLPQLLQTIQSKRGNKEFECKLELTKQENHLTVICPTNGFPEAVSVKQAGMISIRERMKLPQRKENGNVDPDSTDKLFLYPTNLRIRHPLLGVNFENIEIKEEADDSVIISPKKKKVNGHHSNDRIKIKQEPVEELSASSLRKEKKRKRPRDSIEIKQEPSEDALSSPSKKQKHNKKARLDEDSDLVNSKGQPSTPTKHKRTSIKIEPELSLD